MGVAAYRVSYERGVEAGFATGDEVSGVTQDVAALALIGHIEAGRYDRALLELDAQVDSGISVHWIRTKAPDRFADIVESPVELILYLEEYRRSRPSRARSETPHMNELVAEYLAAQDTRAQGAVER